MEAVEWQTWSVFIARTLDFGRGIGQLMPYQHTGNGARPQESDGRGALGLDSSLSESSSRVHGACVRVFFSKR